MNTNKVNEQKAIELLCKIDQKSKELKLLKKLYNDAVYTIVDSWKEDVKNQFPQLKPCEIGEYVGVDIALKGKVYSIFISEDKQKLYCMFSLNPKDKANYEKMIREVMDSADFEKLKKVFNCYLNENKAVAYESTQGFYVKFKKDQFNAAYEFFINLVRTFVLQQ